MIASAAGFADALAALLVMACCWVAGVAWAAYRAVGWVQRMRAWAAGSAGVEPCPGIAGGVVDEQGWN